MKLSSCFQLNTINIIIIIIGIYISLPQITSTEIPICCCFYNKDPFRGFQSTSNQILSIKDSGYDKAEIGNMIMNMCMAVKGFPSVENIERLKNNISQLTKEKCNKECFYLTRQLNDNYIIQQEENRIKEAKNLRKSKKVLEDKIAQQVKINVDSLNRGKSCQIRIYAKTDSKGSLLNEAMSRNNQNKIMDDLEDITFDSVSLSSHHSLDNPDLEMALNAYEDSLNENVNNLRIEDINKRQNDSNEDILKMIDELQLEILYLEKKNTRPIDFILERYTIKDKVLEMIIRIFEKTLNQVISTMKTDMENSIYFQFKIVEKSKKKI